ncbi:NAD-dependent epimerase/dehydratase family protein [Pyxidicoccus fallax]|uniref:NAD-dependent epimerase/dehydratase family protein n=1 Tax=Pyxidicoccus fallax TaxID=394095 RepID=A0A848L9T2_9BACT|nr:NAD-dependent epimerase/dehydratase family protein [Pyxidicoccus fallax]NMO15619.1 NAD-dependent epimerase/dehydratase family protein [Pyxidicoccus fallax]NPC77216.1 NAD-dependent epimerase/dehydratase family protein [Pyxidicoccus fallax]
MKVFITGATGTIGFHVARAFRRAGHEVVGLVRTPAKAKLLEQEEIHPVLGTLQAPAEWADEAARASVRVHAAVDYAADAAELDGKVLDVFLRQGAAGAQKPTVLYTSGIWVQGDTGGVAVDEATPLRPHAKVAWRPAVEQRVLTAESVRGVVLRPGVVYGRSGSLTGMWFQGAVEGELRVFGDGANHWVTVHVEDLADAYVRAAERNVSGETFLLGDGSRERVRDMVDAVVRAAGGKARVTFVPPSQAPEGMRQLAECLALDQVADASKARRLLGWEPLHTGFSAEASTYLAAWKALL